MPRIMKASALIGAAILLVFNGAWASRRTSADVVTGRVLGSNGRPLPGLSVFLDRGTNLVERYETDSAGEFRLPLFPREPHRATWLICAPGAIPIVGKPERDEATGGVTLFRIYDYSPARDTVWRSYRQSGWSGPIPRECPQGDQIVGWRYPASAGRDWGAYTTEEPDWKRFPGPPRLPQH